MLRPSWVNYFLSFGKSAHELEIFAVASYKRWRSISDRKNNDPSCEACRSIESLYLMNFYRMLDSTNSAQRQIAAWGLVIFLAQSSRIQNNPLAKQLADDFIQSLKDISLTTTVNKVSDDSTETMHTAADAVFTEEKFANIQEKYQLLIQNEDVNHALTAHRWATYAKSGAFVTATLFPLAACAAVFYGLSIFMHTNNAGPIVLGMFIAVAALATCIFLVQNFIRTAQAIQYNPEEQATKSDYTFTPTKTVT